MNEKKLIIESVRMLRKWGTLKEAKGDIVYLSDKGVQAKITTYSWGTLRVLTKGSIYTAVLHPESWEKVKGGSGSFRDEQRNLWKIEKSGSDIILSSGSKKFVLSPEDMKKLEGSVKDEVAAGHPRLVAGTTSFSGGGHYKI
jgi:hypothetical protein